MKTSRFHKSFGLIQAVVLIASMLAALVCAQPAAAQAGVPVFRSDTLAYASFQEDASNPGQVIADDSDGPTLTYSVVTQPAHGYLLSFDTATGAFTYRPDGDYNGADTFRAGVTDGTHPVEADVSITVQPVEDAPVVNDDGVYTVSTPAYAWVTAGGTNYASSLAAGDFNGMVNEGITIPFLMPFYNGLYDRIRIFSNGSVQLYNSTGYYNWDYNGLYQHDITRRTAVIGMGGTKYVNKTTTSIYAANVSGQFVIQFNNLLDSQVPNAPSTFEIIFSSDGSIRLQYQTVAGFVDGVGLGSPWLHPRNPVPNYIPGVYLNRAQLNRASNAAFLFTPVQPYLTNINTALTAAAPVGANDFDPDGALTGTRSLKTSPKHGTVTLNADGTFTYTPTTGFVGRDRFTYRVTQADGRYMDADAHVYVTDTSLSAGRVTSPSMYGWSAGCASGYIEGYDYLARPFRFKIQYQSFPTTAYSQGVNWFYPDTGEYMICTQWPSTTETWKGSITPIDNKTTSTVNITVGIPTGNSGLGTGTNGDGLYTLTPTQYASGTQPWDELTGDPQAVDLMVGLPTNDETASFDEHEFTVPIGFTFPFLSGSYNTMYPNSNGFLSFRDIHPLVMGGHEPLPQRTFFSGVHMLPMDGLLNNATLRPGMPTSHIYTRTFYDGETPNRFVIEYVNLAVFPTQEHPDSDRVSTFEVVLYPDGRIETRYRAIDADPALVGIQYTPAYGPAEGDLPSYYGLNLPFYQLANYLTLAYAPGEAYQAVPGSPLTVDAAHGVRANDFSLVSGQTDTPIVYSVAVQPEHGTLSLNSTDGSFTYTAAADYTGRDYFVYTALYNQLTSSNVVAIDVTNPTPAPPVINSVTGSRNIAAGTTATLTVNATDNNHDALDYSYTVAGGGTLSGASINQSTGVFTWPNAVAGSYNITFRAFQENDPTQYDESLVTLLVDGLPVMDAYTGTLTVDEGSTLSFTVNAHDPESNPLTYSIRTNPTSGTFDPATRTFTWATTEADNGTRDVLIRAAETDYPERYDEETYTLTVNEIPSLPAISGITGATTINEGQSFSIVVNASDGDGDPLTYSMPSGPTGSSFDPATRTFTWTPGETSVTAFNVTFRAAETADPTRYDEETYPLTVNEVNQAPAISGVTGAATVNEGEAVNLAVQAADADLPANTLTYAVTGLPSGASFNTTTGVLTWASAVTGSYPMTFTVADNGTPALNDTYDLTLAVIHINQAPVISSVTGSLTVDEGTTLSFTVNATDLENDALTYAMTANDSGGAFNASTHTFTWATTEADNGTFHVTIRVSETATPARYDEETYTLTVNEVPMLPVISGLTGSTTINEGQSFNLTVNASDQDGDALTYSMQSGPAGASFDPAAHVFTWTPGEVSTPTFTVTFRAAETAHVDRYDEETYTLTVNEVNQAPVITGITGDNTVDEETAVALTVNAADADQPANTLTYSVTGLPSGAAFNTATGELTWASAVAGTYNMTFTVTDNGSPALHADYPFTLTVNEVDHEPEITGVTGADTINEGQTFHLTVNASDPDGDALTCSVTEGLPEGANISWNGCQFTWVTTEAEDGTYVLTFRATENKNAEMFGEGLAILTVEEINEAPIINGITGSLTVTEDESVNLAVNAVDADTPGLMSYAVTGLPTGANFDETTGVLTWADPVIGTYSLTFTVHDNDPAGDLTASRSVTLQVTDLDHMPVITSVTGATTVDEGGTITLTISGQDADNDPITYSIFSGPAGAVFNPATRVFTWVTTEADNGDHDVVFRVTENNHANHYGEQTVTLTVNEVNEPPSITSISGPTAAKQGTPVQLSVQAVDIDTPNLMTYAVSYTGTAPAGATFNTATGVWDWASPAIGEYHMTFTVHDNDPVVDLSASHDFILTVSAYDLPVIDSLTGIMTVNEGQDLVITVAAHDPEGGLLSYNVSGLPAGASSGWSGNVFTWHTAESDGPSTPTLTFIVTADNNPARRSQQAQQVTINEVNRAPVLDLSAFTALPSSPWVTEQSTIAFTAAAADPDLPANALTFSLINAPTGAAVNPTTGAFSWTPTHAQAGADYAFTVRVADAGGLADTEEITIRVNALPAFTAPPAALTAVKNRPVQFTLAAADPDSLPTGLTYTLVSALPSGAAYDPATRTFTWTPNGAQLGDFALTFSVTDGLATVQHTVTITVSEGFFTYLPLVRVR